MIDFVHETLVLLGLHEVDVEILIGYDDGLQAAVGCLGAIAHTVPCHDDGLGLVVVVPVVQEFVPYHDVFAVLLLEEDTEFLDEP